MKVYKSNIKVTDSYDNPMEVKEGYWLRNLLKAEKVWLDEEIEEAANKFKSGDFGRITEFEKNRNDKHIANEKGSIVGVYPKDDDEYNDLIISYDPKSDKLYLLSRWEYENHPISWEGKVEKNEKVLYDPEHDIRGEKDYKEEGRQLNKSQREQFRRQITKEAHPEYESESANKYIGIATAAQIEATKKAIETGLSSKGKDLGLPEGFVETLKELAARYNVTYDDIVEKLAERIYVHNDSLYPRAYNNMLKNIDKPYFFADSKKIKDYGEEKDLINYLTPTDKYTVEELKELFDNEFKDYLKNKYAFENEELYDVYCNISSTGTSLKYTAPYELMSSVNAAVREFFEKQNIARSVNSQQYGMRPRTIAKIVLNEESQSMFGKSKKEIDDFYESRKELFDKFAALGIQPNIKPSTLVAMFYSFIRNNKMKEDSKIIKDSLDNNCEALVVVKEGKFRTTPESDIKMAGFVNPKGLWKNFADELEIEKENIKVEYIGSMDDEDYYRVECDYEDKLVRDSKIKDMFEPISSFKEFKFMDKTRQGFEIIHAYRDLDDDRMHVIVYRPNTEDYVIGLGYSPEDGIWNQGIYDLKSATDAEEVLKEDYRVELYKPEEVKEETDIDDVYLEDGYNQEELKEMTELAEKLGISTVGDLAKFKEEYADNDDKKLLGVMREKAKAAEVKDSEEVKYYLGFEAEDDFDLFDSTELDERVEVKFTDGVEDEIEVRNAARKAASQVLQIREVEGEFDLDEMDPDDYYMINFKKLWVEDENGNIIKSEFSPVKLKKSFGTGLYNK